MRRPRPRASWACSATPASMLQLVPLADGPVFHNRETPKGRIQTSVGPGVPLPIPDIPEAWRMARGWSVVPVAGEVTDDWAARHPGRRAPGGGLAGVPAEPGTGRAGHPPAAAPSAILRRADLVGVSHHDVAPRHAAERAVRAAPPGRPPARHAGQRGRPAHHLGPRRPDRDAALPADRDDPRDRPDRCRRHVPGGPPVDRSCGRPSPVATGRVAARTCGSRRRPDRWSSRASVSMACRTGPRSSSGGPASASVARCSRPRSPRSGRSTRPDDPAPRRPA